MKLKINSILPIAIALLLPLISFYTNPSLEFSEMKLFLIMWASSSIMLYIVWVVLWRISSLKTTYRNWGYFVIFIFVVLLSYGVGSWSEEKLVFSQAIRIVFAFSLVLAIQYALKSQQNISRLILEKEQLQTENYKSQLQTLRTQIDPHFLFNSLNTLRAMVRNQHLNSEKFVICLSDFYRQTMKHNKNTTLALKEEIEVLKSYLFLMTNRNEEAVKTKFDIDEALLSFHLPCLALQTIVENCFKHNSMTSKMPLQIEVKTVGDGYVQITNNLQPKIADNESTGFGLDSLKRRYELMNIPEGIKIEKTTDHYRVQLKLISQ